MWHNKKQFCWEVYNLIKTDLPVIILRGIILLPNSDIRLEFDNTDSNNIIDIAELFHENRVLVVSQIDSLEEEIDYDNLPKMGVIGKVNHKIQLPDGKMRVIISGLKRARVYEYLRGTKKDGMLEAIIEETMPIKISETEEDAYIRKLYREVESYIEIVPYASNSIISMLENVKSLDKMTDIIIDYLPLENRRLVQYLKEVNSHKRMEMILEDIYREEDRFRIEREIDTKVQKTMEENQREYLLREKLKEIKSELGELSLKEEEIEELKRKIGNLHASKKIKSRLLKEVKYYESLAPASPEISIVKGYIECMLNLPWKRCTKDNTNLKQAKEILEKSHAGLKEVKLRILEFLAARQMGNIKGPIICLVGPPGVGKTSLARTIATAMNRKFVKFAVGGITDEAEIIGHRRTYLGARPGRIIQEIKKAGTSNPVFLIDEIDKLSSGVKGDPVYSLLSILDPGQNRYFSDNYIEEEYDLSKVMFIATANNLYDIPEPLRDRLEIIEVSGYTEYEKLEIAKHYILPKIQKNYGLEKYTITFEQGVLEEIIQSYTMESGVRDLERKIEMIIRKLVMSILLSDEKKETYTIKAYELKNYLGKTIHKNNYLLKEDIGIVNGLSYTNYGGDTLPIEVNYFPGNGTLLLTGSLGEVIRESAQIALDYIKANRDVFHISSELIQKQDIHINIPEGGVPKDGPSAGIALVTSIISTFTNKKISSSIAMTGEITLRGNVLAIGGLKEKVIGAYRRNISTIFLPKQNEQDLEDIPKEVRDNIKFIFVKDYMEVYNNLF